MIATGVVYTGGKFFGIFYVLYSTLPHLPPLRFHCVGGCWDRTQDLRLRHYLLTSVLCPCVGVPEELRWCELKDTGGQSLPLSQSLPALNRFTSFPSFFVWFYTKFFSSQNRNCLDLQASTLGVCIDILNFAWMCSKDSPFQVIPPKVHEHRKGIIL
jgi:hypothetical protein